MPLDKKPLDYLSQWWPRYMSPNVVTRPQWVEWAVKLPLTESLLSKILTKDKKMKHNKTIYIFYGACCVAYVQRLPKQTSYSPKRYFNLVGQVTVTWHSSDGRADNNCTYELYSLWTSRHLVSDKCWCHITCPKDEWFSNFTATSDV